MERRQGLSRCVSDPPLDRGEGQRLVPISTLITLINTSKPCAITTRNQLFPNENMWKNGRNEPKRWVLVYVLTRFLVYVFYICLGTWCVSKRAGKWLQWEMGYSSTSTISLRSRSIPLIPYRRASSRWSTAWSCWRYHCFSSAGGGWYRTSATSKVRPSGLLGLLLELLGL